MLHKYIVQLFLTLKKRKFGQCAISNPDMTFVLSENGGKWCFYIFSCFFGGVGPIWALNTLLTLVETFQTFFFIFSRSVSNEKISKNICGGAENGLNFNFEHSGCRVQGVGLVGGLVVRSLCDCLCRDIVILSLYCYCHGSTLH